MMSWYKVGNEEGMMAVSLEAMSYKPRWLALGWR